MFYIRLWNQYWSGHDIIIIYFLLRNFAHVFSARVIMLFLSPRPTQCPVQASNNRNQRGERSQIGNCYISDLVPQIDPSVPQPVVQSRRRPLLGPSPG